MTRTSRILITAVVALCAAAPAASAATVELVLSPVPTLYGPSHDAVLRAAPGERNDVTVEREAYHAVVLRDAGAPLTAGAGCTALPDGAVRCPAPHHADAVLELGDGADRARGAARLVEGGEGDDDLAAEGGTVARGGPGDDVLRGVGMAVLEGGPGGDVFEALDGARPQHGGAIVSYADRTTGVGVDVGGGADDGEPGEGDDVRSASGGITGGAGDDQLAGPGTLAGGAGDDRLAGAGPHGTLEGGPGDDVLLGGDGEDTLMGGPGADTLGGGAGRDLVTYASPPAPGPRDPDVVVTLDGERNDGAAGEGDLVERDVEDLTGGDGDDVLVGDTGPNRLGGWAGRDRLAGGGGDDELQVSSTEPSVAEGGPGRDVLRGAGERTTVRLRDGEADELLCAYGLPRDPELDPGDLVRCSDLAAVEGAPTVTVSPSGRIAVPLRCASWAPCAGALRLEHGGTLRPLASVPIALPAGGRATVALRVPKATLDRLRRSRRLTAFAGVAMFDDPEASTVRRAAVRLVASRFLTRPKAKRPPARRAPR